MLTPEIFDALRDLEPGVGGEIQLTDAINAARAGAGRLRATCSRAAGSTSGTSSTTVKATIELAIDREDIGKDVRRWLADLVERKKLI